MTERLALDPAPESPRAARAFVMGWLEAWGYDGLIDPATLVVSELATNAVRHVGQPFTVEVEDLGHGVQMSVHDPVSAAPRPRTASPADVSGRGMRIVDALTDRWGTTQVEGHGKVVWCQFQAVDLPLGSDASTQHP